MYVYFNSVNLRLMFWEKPFIFDYVSLPKRYFKLGCTAQGVLMQVSIFLLHLEISVTSHCCGM